MPDSSINSICFAKREKPVLVLLHGWGQSLLSLRPLGELLSDCGRIYLLDLPGFGASSAPEAAWGTADYSRRLAQFFSANNIDSAVLIGHSFGGKLSMQFAADYPALVEGLVLIDASGLKPVRPCKQKLRHQTIAFLRFIMRLLERLGLRLYSKWFIPRFASPDYLNAGPLRSTFVKVVNEDLSHLIPRIAAPVLLLWGENDIETPLEMAQRLERTLQNSKLIILPGRGHYPFLDSGLHLCAHYIKSFIKVSENE